MDFTFETHLVVKYGDQIWAPAQLRVDDQTFFQFSKWDRGFVKFATGKSLDLRKDKTACSTNCEFMDQILARRQSACDDALHAALAGDEEGQKTKRLRRRANASDAHLVPKVLNMSLPAVAEEGLGERLVRVLFEGASTASIYMQMSEDIVDHLRKGIQHSSRHERSRKKTGPAE